MKTVAYKNLKPGMICEDWDNGGKKIKSVVEVERPGRKYSVVVVEFEDGTRTSATPVSKMNVR